MTEEQVTKAILKYLQDCGWTIVAFDFPQSGTGKMLHPDDNMTEKNKDSIIPDIVAVKNEICLFFEIKDRTVLDDFEKIARLINDNKYANAINSLLAAHAVKKIYFGVGLPLEKVTTHTLSLAEKVDFTIGVDAGFDIIFAYNPNGLVL